MSQINNSTLHDISITPLMYNLKKSLNEILHPITEFYDEGCLQVSERHSLWYAQYGNPQGVSVIIVHGGPGGGCNEEMRFFDLKFYRVILLDQRGTKRSKPVGELKDNTTQNLIEDLEILRKHLKINKWLVFGGSWGTALSIAYGEAYSEQCLGFILRGIFLARNSDIQQIWYGMKDYFPEAWEEYVNYLPSNERNDLIQAYDRQLSHPDVNIQLAAARAFMKYDLNCSFAFKNENVDNLLQNDGMVLTVAKIFMHFCKNHFYLAPNQLLINLHKIKDLPAIIINGRFDVINPPKNALELHRHWPNSKLVIVQDAGHASSEPGIAKALIEATEQMKTKVNIK